MTDYLADRIRLEQKLDDRTSGAKKRFTCTHKELTELLSPLKAAGVYINESGENGGLYILKNWVENTGDIIFGAKPVGRKDDAIIYECMYADEFDAAMMTIEH